MVRQVISEALALYRGLFGQLVVLTLVVFLPLTVALLVLELVVPTTSSTEQGLAIIDAVGSVLLFAPLASIAIIRCAIAFEQTGSARARSELAPAFALLVPYVGTQLLVLLMIVAVPGALIAVGYAADSPAIVTMGAGVLLGSALFNGVRLAVATMAVVTHDARFGQALRRSAGLTRGSWLRTLGVLLSLTAVALVIAGGFSVIGLAFPVGAPQNVASALLGLVANALTVPLISLGTYRLYRALEAQASARRAA